MSIRLDGKVAIVTGAGGGLGKAYAKLLAARGAKVVVNDFGGKTDGTGGSQGPAHQTVDEIIAAGGEAAADVNNVATQDGAKAIIQSAIDAFGTVDILVNNAGILRDKSFHKMELSDFEAVIGVHLMGTVYCTHAAYPVMRDKEYGRIVCITSGSGLFGNFGQTNYGAAKLGIVGFMNSLKQEASAKNVFINCVAPLAATRMTEGLPLFSEEAFSYIKPEVIAPVVAYLASEACTSSGDIISATAGYYAKAQIVEAEGFRVPLGSDVTPEIIASNFGTIADMEAARPYPNLVEEIKAALAPVMS
ncbi:SDR family NAD(P)-dependent oxidoreductase [Radicibacter daui]|jgi:NAD(P)-dependent dehydrogenase (short-subunit alcohol dehydrogenase family)|uniref:SDR family NAD(P)-dependent oxidoreductase n=1 Tax=Radicibacter daui TaxID=3064829 RepID=UPI004046F6A3